MRSVLVTSQNLKPVTCKLSSLLKELHSHICILNRKNKLPLGIQTKTLQVTNLYIKTRFKSKTIGAFNVRTGFSGATRLKGKILSATEPVSLGEVRTLRSHINE